MAAEQPEFPKVRPSASRAFPSLTLPLMGRYDINQDGVIEELELVEAMKVFQQDHWKFEGVLW